MDELRGGGGGGGGGGNKQGIKIGGEGKNERKGKGGRSVKCGAINLTLYARWKINALSNFINSSLHNEPQGERITFLNAAIMPSRLRTVIASIPW